MALDYEQLLITNEMSEIIRWHNQCLERLRHYRETYPYLMAPNLARMMEENLKENVQMLYRELNNLHKPKAEQRRHVCRVCHGVYAISLPGGMCDECRAKYGNNPPPQAAPAVTQAPEEIIADEEPLEEESQPAETENAVSEAVDDPSRDEESDFSV